MNLKEAIAIGVAGRHGVTWSPMKTTMYDWCKKLLLSAIIIIILIIIITSL